MRSIIHRILFNFTKRLPCRLIKVDENPYLERYYLGQLFGVTFYLHRFVSGDSERHTHNHPWTWARSIVLSGSYVEDFVTDFCAFADGGFIAESRRVRFYNRINANYFHRIREAKPNTWTLFFHSKRAMLNRNGMASRLKGWGFLELDTSQRYPVLQFHQWPMRPYAWWEFCETGENAGREPMEVQP